MNVKTITVRDFRNYGEFTAGFSDGVNVLSGKNGVGKTNLLEAMFLFASGRSFRGAKDREMISFGKESASAKLVFTQSGTENTLEARLYRGKKRELFKNGCQVTRLSEYLGLFRAVVFTPDHMSLVKGAPENRRRFLDVAMCQSFPRYVACLSEYNRVLMQKNTCLKSESPDDILLEIYSERLASLGAMITKNRRSFVLRLAEKTAEIYSDMTCGAESLAVSFETQAGEAETSEEIKNAYLSLFEQKRETEKFRKACLYGAQRDDFSVYIKDKNARVYASQGQQRSAVLSLKLAEGAMSEIYTGEPCVYLLDDILSELDAQRQGFILQKLSGRQFIITCCGGLPQAGGRVTELK